MRVPAGLSNWFFKCATCMWGQMSFLLCGITVDRLGEISAIGYFFTAVGKQNGLWRLSWAHFGLFLE